MNDTTPFKRLGSVETLTAGSGSHFSDTGAGMQDSSSDGIQSYEALPAR
jgi:hypothetical protein